MSNITLNASMRSNLLSLKNIATQMDKTQLILATGKKVNSAIDNASSYYQARSLSNRAADLTALLDSMGQGIQTIEAATTGIEHAIIMLEQAQAVANSALEKGEEIIARVATKDELLAAIQSGKSGLIVIDGDIILSENQTLELKDGQSLVGKKYLGETGSSSLEFNITNFENPTIMVGNNSMIADLDINYIASDKKAGSGIIYADGKTGVVIQNTNIDFNINSTLDGYFGAIYGGEIEVRGYLNIIDNGATYPDYSVNHDNRVNNGIIKSTLALKDNAVLNINMNGCQSQGVRNANIVLEGNSILNIKTNGYQGINIINSDITMKDESIINSNSLSIGMLNTTLNMENAKTRVNMKVKNAFGCSSAWSEHQMLLNMTSGAQITTNSGVYEAKDNVYAVLPDNFWGNDLSSFGVTQTSTTAPDLSSIFDDFAQYITESSNKVENLASQTSEEKQFDQIIKEYDKLLSDCGYQGINLLKGGNLKVVFDENRTHVFNVLGQDITSKALNITEALWQTQGDIEDVINQLNTSITTLRSLAENLGNQYSVITTRINFTEGLTDILETGADNLTLADMNEASAQYLSLQTRQQLAINSLSLASQSAQSILRLF